MSKRIRVLNVPIDVVTMSEATQKVHSFIKEKNTHMIVTANAEMVMLAQEERELFSIISDSDLVVADGAGVVWAARFQGDYLPERVAGYDLVQNILRSGSSYPLRVFLFGGSPGIAEKAKKKIENEYKGIMVVGVEDGFFNKEKEEAILTNIVATAPDLLLVALGVPKQEKWIKRHLDRMKVPVVIGVGGTFDVMAGVVKRAPVWMQRSNLEWLYRLMLQPKRFLRMLALPRFVLKVVASKKNN